MAIRIDDLQAKADAARERWANIGPTVDVIASYLRINRSMLATATGVKRPTLTNWLAGTVSMPGWYAEVLSEMLGIPMDVLQSAPNDALRWVLDHPAVSKVKIESK
jgi:hypothetical protein